MEEDTPPAIPVRGFRREDRILRFKSLAKRAFRAAVGSRLYERLEFRRHNGYWPDTDEPRTFNEKLSARKLRDFPHATLLADKLAVRALVARRAGSDLLPRLYYSGHDPDSINYTALPSRFVVKGTHGSGTCFRLIVRDKAALPRHRFVAMARTILRRRFGPEVNEWWYAGIPPNLLIEEMLLDTDGSLPADFKCYVFGGKVRYIQVITGREDNAPVSRFYDPSWRPQPFTRGSWGLADVMARPEALDSMIAVAEILGAGFEFVRVDLYAIGRHVLFGEMTLTPGAGWLRFNPPVYDELLGREWAEFTQRTIPLPRRNRTRAEQNTGPRRPHLPDATPVPGSIMPNSRLYLPADLSIPPGEREDLRVSPSFCNRAFPSPHALVSCVFPNAEDS